MTHTQQNKTKQRKRNHKLHASPKTYKYYGTRAPKTKPTKPPVQNQYSNNTQQTNTKTQKHNTQTKPTKKEIPLTNQQRDKATLHPTTISTTTATLPLLPSLSLPKQRAAPTNLEDRLAGSHGRKHVVVRPHGQPTNCRGSPGHRAQNPSSSYDRPATPLTRLLQDTNTHIKKKKKIK